MFRLGKATPFRNALRFLIFFFCYPEEVEKSISVKFIVMCFLMRISTFICCCLATFLHLVMMKKEGREVETCEDLFLVSGGLGSIVICGTFARSSKQWFEYLKRLLDFEEYGLRNDFEKEMNQRNFLGYVYGTYYVIGVGIYGIITMMNSDCQSLNEDQNMHLICETLFPVWLPFDLPQRAFRLTLFVIQLVTAIGTVNPAAMVCFLILEATETISIHIHLLNSHFKIIVQEGNIRTRPDGIGFWVQYHNHILKLAENLRDLARQSIGSVSLFSALVLGCTEYSLMRTKPIGGILFMIGWMAGLMIVCYAGERLMEEIVSVGAAISESQWYITDGETKKDIVFILLRSQKPIYLEAAPIGILNYALFVMILRTSYSYMTLLNQTA